MENDEKKDDSLWENVLRDALLKPNEEEKNYVKRYTECTTVPEETFTLVDKIDASDLEELKHYFFPEGKNFSRILSEMELYDVGMTRQPSRGIPLTKESFVAAVKSVIGTPSYETAAANLFDMLQKKKIIKHDVIWWEQLLDAIIEGGQDKKEPEPGEAYTFKEKNNILMSHCKSKIVKILLPETPHSACYIIISSLGKVGIYDDGFVLQESYQVPMGNYTSKRSSWITSACYASDTSSMFISSSNRRLFIYNISQLIHKLQFSIEGIPNSPTCLHYSILSSEKKSILFIGDDRGDIISISFQQPQKAFFKQKHLKHELTYNWMDITNQDDYAKIRICKGVHQEEVLEVFYIEENDSLISCSSDPSASVVIKERQGKRTLSILKLEKGVKHFHLSRKICLLATTNTDHFIMLWNPVQMLQPIKILKGHKEPVIDVCILKHVQSILSLSAKGVLKVWSLESFVCLQTIHLKYPCSDQMVDTSSNKIYPGLRQFPQSVSKAYSLFQTLHTQANLDWDGPDCMSETFRDVWMRTEFVVTYFNYVKIVTVETKISMEFTPLPLPRRNLEPALPTPYYPLTHTFRENTKMLKQRMFKNLAGLAPFYDLENVVTTFKYKCIQDTKELKKLVREGVPHFGVVLSSTKEIDYPLFKKTE